MVTKRGLSLKHPFGWAITLLLMGYFVRMYSLTSAPLGIGGDEVFYYNDAVRILALGDFQVYYPTNFGHEPLFIYAEALTVALFGHHAFVLRYTAVIGGVLMLVGSYVLARRLFGATVALWTLALFASIFWPVFITRVGLRAFTFPLLTIYSIYALWRALQDRSWKWSWWAAIFTGLTLYTYIASRVFPAVVVLWLFILVFLKREWLSQNISRLVFILGLATLIVLPYLLFALTNPEIVNQRPNTMGGPWFEIQRGDFSGLLRNIQDVAGMFTVRGDSDERYNPFRLPVFDPVIGVLFYLGILMAAWRWRSPAYALIWIWLGVGLLPTLLSGGAPAWLRAGGALFPILVLPSIGFQVGWSFLSRYNQFSKQFAFGLALVAALVGGVRCLGLFLGPWRTNPEMMQVYESDVYLAAQYLARNPPPPETQVLLVARAASDSEPMLFELQSDLEGRVTWASEMVWPAEALDTWYLFTQDSLPNALTRQWLNVAPVHIETDNAGNHVLEVYRPSAAPVAPQPQIPVTAEFNQLLDLVGVSYLQPLQRGTTAEILLFWRVRPDFTFNRDDWPRLFVRLRAGQKIWAQTDIARLAYPPVDWQANAVWVQTVKLEIPADAPPIAVQPEVGVYSNTFTWPVITRVGEPARLTAELPPASLAGQPVTDAPLPTGAVWVDVALALQSFKLRVPAIGPQPGLPLTVEATWRVLASLPTDGAVQLRLISGSTTTLAETEAEVIYASEYPTSRWQANEVITSQHTITIPADAASGEYQVQLRWLPTGNANSGSEWVTLAPVKVAGRAHIFTQPPLDGEILAQVSDVAELVGYRLEPKTARAGDALRLMLVWRALQATERPIKVFVHVYGLADAVTIFGQHDSEPGNGALPSLGWVAGEYLEDAHLVPLEATAPPGTYRIGVGMYDPDTLQRLPVRLSDGTVTDYILVTSIEIQP